MSPLHRRYEVTKRHSWGQQGSLELSTRQETEKCSPKKKKGIRGRLPGGDMLKARGRSKVADPPAHNKQSHG